MLSNHLEDHNLVFFSNFQWDVSSRTFMEELTKNRGLEKQFRKISIHSPNNPNAFNPILPQSIKKSLQMNIQCLPIMVAAGFNNIIYGPDAVTWIKNNTFNDGGKVLDFGNLGNSSVSSGCALTENGDLTHDRMFGDQEFHMMGNSVTGVVNTSDTCCPIGQTIDRIDTFEDNTTKHDARRDIDNRMSQLKAERDLQFQPGRPNMPSVPSMVGCRSVSGGGGMGGGGGGGSNMGNGGGLQYNPDPMVPVNNGYMGGRSRPMSNRNVPQVPSFGRM